MSSTGPSTSTRGIDERVADAHRHLRELAEACARVGGKIVLDARAPGVKQIHEKAQNDFVTEVDQASERAIVSLLAERAPGQRILAEESAGMSRGSWAAHEAASAHAAGGGDIEWIIDPLDGTKNFIHGYPAYCVAVAARAPSGVLAGAIYDPVRDQLFSAARGDGATLNGEPIRVTNVENPKRALVATGFPFRFAELTEPYLDSFQRVIAAVSDVRRGGSASLDLAYVACGRLDGFWELALSPWDIAAGWLLIEEAGGVVTDDAGEDDLFGRGHVVAGGERVHSVLLEIARQSFTGRVEAFGAPAR